MKPEHTRPFNREHAEAGAPFACANGLEAHVLRWHKDGAIGYFVGVAGSEIATGWINAGHRRAAKHTQDEYGLVMVPLGMCQGKPVWWDSTLISPGGTEFRVCEMSNTTAVAYTYCRWPVAAPVIETKMTDAEMFIIWSNPDEPRCYGNCNRALVNAGIARAIADGQVVPAPQFVDNLARSIKFSEKIGADILAAEKRKARDMAVAEAVMNATRQGLAVSNFEGTTCLDWRNIDLAAVIAKVQS